MARSSKKHTKNQSTSETRSSKKDKKNQSISNFKLAPLNPCVAGIDIGAKSVFVCIGFADGHQEVREYLTFTEDLKNMLSWIQQNNIKKVAMESTGVYWIPIYDILAQAGVEVTLANAYYVKTLPGRKSDVQDCQWLQQLHAYGLVPGSFRPDDEGVIFRGYVRQRTRLFELAAQQVQLMQKAMVQMNLRLKNVLSDITGATGMRIIRAILSGERNPATLARYRESTCKKEEKAFAKALDGNYRQENLLALKHALEAYDLYHQQALECEKAIKQILEKWEEAAQLQRNENEQNTIEAVDYKKVGRTSRKKSAYNKSPYHFDAKSSLQGILTINLTEIPGLEVNTIMRILSETGTDMSKWPSAKHFASWLGLCPNNKISGGKVLSSKSKQTANRAAQALRLAANALLYSRTALGAYYRRMRTRLGSPKAITAAAHKLAKILYAMLKERKNFVEIGQEQYEEAYKARKLWSLKKRAQEFGYTLVECPA